jgi:hypothetical protein
MNRGRIHSAKLGKTQRILTAAWGLVLGILSLAFFSWTFCHSSTQVNSIINVSDDSSSSPLYWDWSDAASPPPAKLLADRPVYPYSVIPGGAHSGRELLEAAQREPVVAAHYAAFAVRNAREIRLADDKRAYVSYRLGNQIYWTKKKMTLHKGEILLTDGEHLARTRCGNRVSETPTEPTSPSEPEEIVLNDPSPPAIPVTTTGSPLPWPIWPRSTPLLTMLDTPAGSVPGLPFFPPIPCCGSPTGTSHAPSPATLPQSYPPPLVATPEPNSLVLLTVGGIGLLILKPLIAAIGIRRYRPSEKNEYDPW